MVGGRGRGLMNQDYSLEEERKQLLGSQPQERGTSKLVQNPISYSSVRYGKGARDSGGE